MRIGIIGSADSWYVSDLRRAAPRGHTIQVVSFTALSARVRSNSPNEVLSGECRLNSLDALIVRSMPPGSLEQVVFRMDALAALEQAGVTVVNPPKSLEAAIDKFLTTRRLAEANLPTPETIVCQDYETAVQGFDDLGGDIVVKPLFGGEGRGLMRVSDRGLAHRTFRTLTQLNSTIYMQPFIEHHGEDIRLFRVGDDVLGMRRRNSNDWRSNVSQGGVASALSMTEQWREWALRASDAVGAELAGVDVIQGPEGPVVLEVNAVPGWRALQRVVAGDVAERVLAHVARRASDGSVEEAAAGRESSPAEILTQRGEPR